VLPRDERNQEIADAKFCQNDRWPILIAALFVYVYSFCFYAVYYFYFTA